MLLGVGCSFEDLYLQDGQTLDGARVPSLFWQKIIWLRQPDNIVCSNYQPLITVMLPSVSAILKATSLVLLYSWIMIFH